MTTANNQQNHLATASFKVRRQSMLINAEFVKTEHDPEAQIARSLAG